MTDKYQLYFKSTQSDSNVISGLREKVFINTFINISTLRLIIIIITTNFKDTAPKRTKWKLKIYLSTTERKYRRFGKY